MSRRATWWMVAYGAVVAAFLATVATYYSPSTGFTFFIEFPVEQHGRELPIVQQAPHHDHRGSGGYDGQYYAQIALDPLLRDPAIDRSVDAAPYRARRILFCWTAYVLGLGQPAWVLQAYAVQNVAAWLLLAWLLSRWFPPSNARAFALWTGCLLTHGAIASVRYALVDGPSTLLLAAAVALAESNRPLTSAWLMGLAGLGRETMVLGAGLFAGLIRRRPRSWAIVATCLVVTALPLALWLDYLRSIYRSLLFTGGEPLAAPFAGVMWKVRVTWQACTTEGLTSSNFASLTALVGLGAQVGCVLWGLTRSPRLLWAWAAVPFILLACLVDVPVWKGSPGAFTRVLLPLAIGANMTLASGRPRWWLIGLVNLGVIPAVMWFVRL